MHQRLYTFLWYLLIYALVSAAVWSTKDDQLISLFIGVSAFWAASSLARQTKSPKP